MKQVGKALKPLDFQLSPLRLLWPILALLASFVFFLEFIANVGGGDDLLPPPAENASPPTSPTPSPTPDPFPDTSILPPSQRSAGRRRRHTGPRPRWGDPRLRYYGVEAAEPGEAHFHAAKEANDQVVGGKTIRHLAGRRDKDEAGLRQAVRGPHGPLVH